MSTVWHRLDDGVDFGCIEHTVGHVLRRPELVYPNDNEVLCQ